MAVANRSGVPRAAEETAVTILDVERIDPSPRNVRRQFPESELVRLATSIDEIGLLSPIIVRPTGSRFEIVAGERRWRAVKLLGRLEIDAAIRELDDREAAEIGLLENLDRVDLNPLERAAGFELLLSLGHSTESIAELCTLTDSSVRNSIELLNLPDWWRNRVRDGLLSQAAAEYLLPWLDYPSILRFMESTAERWPMPLTAWGAKIVEIVMSNSRPMDAGDPHGPQFEIAGKLRDELQTVEVRVSPRLTVPRAMNVARWDELQAAAQEAAQETARRPPTPANGKPHRSKTKPADIGIPGDPPAAGEPLPETSAKTLETDVDGWRWDFLANLIGDRLTEFDAAGLERFAKHIGIDVESEIRKAAVDAGIDPVAIGDGPELVAAIVAAG